MDDCKCFVIVSIYFIMNRFLHYSLQFWKNDEKDFLTDSWYKENASNAGSKELVTYRGLLNELANESIKIENTAKSVVNSALDHTLSTSDKLSRVIKELVC